MKEMAWAGVSRCVASRPKVDGNSSKLSKPEGAGKHPATQEFNEKRLPWVRQPFRTPEGVELSELRRARRGGGG
jgi:hypothetical protein